MTDDIQQFLFKRHVCKAVKMYCETGYDMHLRMYVTLRMRGDIVFGMTLAEAVIQ